MSRQSIRLFPEFRMITLIVYQPGSRQWMFGDWTQSQRFPQPIPAPGRLIVVSPASVVTGASGM